MKDNNRSLVVGIVLMITLSRDSLKSSSSLEGSEATPRFNQS